MQPHLKSANAFAKAYKARIEERYVVPFKDSTTRQRYHVLGELIFSAISEQWRQTKAMYQKEQPKQVHYFSMEFLMGRLITNNINNLGLRPLVEDALSSLKLSLDELEHYESDAGLGNGGLGRLAACFLDSIASLNYAGHGNGIRYRYGLFEQEIQNGYQVEKPDDWLKDQYVWEVRVEEDALDIAYGGYVDYQNGGFVYRPDEIIQAVPYDVPIVGDKNGLINHLRLWNAEPTKVYPAHKHAFEYDQEIRRISGFLYPDDTTYEGKVLRIKQQYFFSAAGVQSLLKKHLDTYKTLDNFAALNVIQINDTHPSLVIPEMMRNLMDVYEYGWDEAWAIVTKTCAYTNHTLLAEALEKWPTSIIQPVLPRIYQIIEEINRRYVSELRSFFNDDDALVHKLAIISGQEVRMAHLAIVGSFSVNGVAALHTQLLKTIEMKEFDAFYPKKFNNKTNGITHRRWLEHINPELTALIQSLTGKDVFEVADLKALLDHKDDVNIQQELKAIKRAKKEVLAARIKAEQDLTIDPDSIFDVQIKRLHEYKRQLMNALHIMMVYNRLKTDLKFKDTYVPHTFIFGAKAASGYYYAKKIIKLINTIAHKVNQDPDTNELLKVVFVENYNVTYAEQIIPACDLSEQISTASKEASGTGNMKFMMNGAITIGTMDGANVEIAELVGEDNIVIFGMNAQEVNEQYAKGSYNPKDIYNSNPEIRTVIDQLTNGFFGHVARDEFKEIQDKLLYHDQYFVLKDLEAYQRAHEEANTAYRDETRWWSMALTNIAQSGFFSSDRTITQYAKEIWGLKPLT